MAETEPTLQVIDDVLVWRTSLPGVQFAILPPSSDRPNPSMAHGMLFASVFAPGGVYALDAGTGAICWHRELPDLGGASVKHVGNILLAKNANTLYALDHASGSIRWSFCPLGTDGETMYSEPAVDGGRLFIGDRAGWLHCLSVETGETLWKQKTSDARNRDVNATAVVTAGLVITGTNAGFAMAYAVEDGRPVWQAQLDGACTKHLFQVGQQVIAVTGSLHFLDSFTGALHGRVNWTDICVSFAAGTPSSVVLFTQNASAEWETGELVPETVFFFEGTRQVCETRCSACAHGLRYSDATGLVYAAGVTGLDVLRADTGDWLYTIRPPEMSGGFGLPDVPDRIIYTMTGNGVICALRHPDF